MLNHHFEQRFDSTRVPKHKLYIYIYMQPDVIILLHNQFWKINYEVIEVDGKRKYLSYIPNLYVRKDRIYIIFIYLLLNF